MMVLFRFLWKNNVSIILVSISIIGVLHSIYACVNQIDSCMQDCECCGFGTESRIVCQARDHDLGPRCYAFRIHGEDYSDDSQWKSQQCANGKCQAVSHATITKPALCPVACPIDDLTASIGELASEDDAFPFQDVDACPEGSELEKCSKQEKN